MVAHPATCSPSRLPAGKYAIVALPSRCCSTRSRSPVPPTNSRPGNPARCPDLQLMGENATPSTCAVLTKWAAQPAGDNRARNQGLIDTLARLAADKGVSPSQLAIAWVLAKQSRVVPVIGARTRAQLDESLAALDVTLTPADVAEIEQTIPPSAVVGTRYDERQMKILDSER